PIKGKPPKTQFQVLMEKLPDTHKAKWLSGAALNSSEQGMASVLSTVLSKLNAFLDSEMENILCFDTEIDAEKFCKEKSAIFLILPEEDPLKYFMVSLFLQQFYREMLTVADECGGKLPNRVVIYADEIGTIPPIDSFEMMLSAGRSRGITVVPIIQSFAQLRKNYGAEGSEIITDNTQLTIFGGFAPNSKTAEELSKALGSRTVMSGSVSTGKDNPSQSLQMMERPLMTPEELKSLPKGNFVVMKTGCHPVKTKLKLFLDWGITFDKTFMRKEREDKEVFYANRILLAENILKKHPKQVVNTPTENDRKTMKSNSMKRDKPKEKFKV
ncbi:MAG: TraM recognition domain-containing protein, partial [Clostridia bacterium]